MKPTPPGDLDQLLHLVRVGENIEPVSNEFREGFQLVIEIPAEITTNHERWREATRQAFTSAVDAGYVVEGFYVNETARSK